MRRVWKVLPMAGAPGAAFQPGQGTSHFDQSWTAESGAPAAPPHHHKVPFENEEVEGQEVTVAPGLPSADRGPKEDGTVILLPAGLPHQMENLESTKPLKAIRVGLKKSL